MCCRGNPWFDPQQSIEDMEFDPIWLEYRGKLGYSMSVSTVALRNTVSGVVSEFDAKTAERYMNHPRYSKILVPVQAPTARRRTRTKKTEEN